MRLLGKLALLAVMLFVAAKWMGVAPKNIPTTTEQSFGLPVANGIPPPTEVPHAFSIVPRNSDHTPDQMLADADEVLRRFARWKAHPTDDGVVPFSDQRNARVNLMSIGPQALQFEDAKTKAVELDAIAAELAQAELKIKDKIIDREKKKEALARLNDVDGRKAFRKTVEETFLRAGMDAHVSLEGERLTVLRVKYIGFTRPVMFKMQEEGIMLPQLRTGARSHGFRKLLMQGYELTWTFDLEKDG